MTRLREVLVHTQLYLSVSLLLLNFSLNLYLKSLLIKTPLLLQKEKTNPETKPLYDPQQERRVADPEDISLLLFSAAVFVLTLFLF